MASEYLKWKYRDVRPDPPIQRTRKQKLQNWWHYHRVPLLILAICLWALFDILGHALRIGVREPDYDLAYVASAPLSSETIAALETALAAMGEDCNGDGQVTVRVHSYVDMKAAQDSSHAQYAAAAQVQLMADLESCESYFFLLDDNETFHINYQVLAAADGSLAEPPQVPACYPWQGCPALSALPVDQTELTHLFLARRGFWGDRLCKHKEQCDALWDRLTEGATL